MNQRGYTLLEVSLFLAISGFLMAIALIGLTPRLRNVRFTQSVRATESNLAKQSGDFNSGVNSRINTDCVPENFFGNRVKFQVGIAATGAASQCVLNGRLIVFGQTSVTYYPIISIRDSNLFENVKTCLGLIGASATSFDKALCYGPTVFNASGTAPKQVFSYPNGVQNSKVVNGYGFLQDPVNGQRYAFTIPVANLQAKKIPDSFTGSVTLKNDLNATVSGIASTCLNLTPRKASITFNAADQSLKTDFDGGAC